MSFTLPDLASQWNALAEHEKKVRGSVERELYRYLTRQIMPDLTSSELRVLQFIYGRTVGWQKFAEAIPMSHFLHGMRDRSGRLMADDEGQSFARGCGIGKEDTVRKAVKSLSDRGIIDYIGGGPSSISPCNVYFCTSLASLAKSYLGEGGHILPDYYEGYLQGEHLIVDNAMCRFEGYSDGTACVYEVDKRLRPISAVTVLGPSAKVRRPTLKEWNRFKENVSGLREDAQDVELVYDAEPESRFRLRRPQALNAA